MIAGNNSGKSHPPIAFAVDFTAIKITTHCDQWIGFIKVKSPCENTQTTQWYRRAGRSEVDHWAV